MTHNKQQPYWLNDYIKYQQTIKLTPQKKEQIRAHHRLSTLPPQQPQAKSKHLNKVMLNWLAAAACITAIMFMAFNSFQYFSHSNDAMLQPFTEQAFAEEEYLDYNEHVPEKSTSIIRLSGTQLISNHSLDENTVAERAFDVSMQGGVEYDVIITGGNSVIATSSENDYSYDTTNQADSVHISHASFPNTLFVRIYIIAKDNNSQSLEGQELTIIKHRPHARASVENLLLHLEKTTGSLLGNSYTHNGEPVYLYTPDLVFCNYMAQGWMLSGDTSGRIGYISIADYRAAQAASRIALETSTSIQQTIPVYAPDKLEEIGVYTMSTNNNDTE